MQMLQFHLLLHGAILLTLTSAVLQTLWLLVGLANLQQRMFACMRNLPFALLKLVIVQAVMVLYLNLHHLVLQILLNPALNAPATLAQQKWMGNVNRVLTLLKNIVRLILGTET